MYNNMIHYKSKSLNTAFSVTGDDRDTCEFFDSSDMVPVLPYEPVFDESEYEVSFTVTSVSSSGCLCSGHMTAPSDVRSSYSEVSAWSNMCANNIDMRGSYSRSDTKKKRSLADGREHHAKRIDECNLGNPCVENK